MRGQIYLEGKLFADAIFADTRVYFIAGQQNGPETLILFRP